MSLYLMLLQVHLCDRMRKGKKMRTHLRSFRGCQHSIKYPTDEYFMLTYDGEPKIYQEAMGIEKKDRQLVVMREEMNTTQENHAYDLVPLPKGKRDLKNKWIFKMVILNPNISPNRV